MLAEDGIIFSRDAPYKLFNISEGGIDNCTTFTKPAINYTFRLLENNSLDYEILKS